MAVVFIERDRHTRKKGRWENNLWEVGGMLPLHSRTPRTLTDTEDARVGSALRTLVPEFRKVSLKSVCMRLDPSTFSPGPGRARVA